MKPFSNLEAPNNTWEDGQVVFLAMEKAASFNYKDVLPFHLEVARHYGASQAWLGKHSKKVYQAICRELEKRKTNE